MEHINQTKRRTFEQPKPSPKEQPQPIGYISRRMRKKDVTPNNQIEHSSNVSNQIEIATPLLQVVGMTDEQQVEELKNQNVISIRDRIKNSKKKKAKTGRASTSAKPSTKAHKKLFKDCKVAPGINPQAARKAQEETYHKMKAREIGRRKNRLPSRGIVKSQRRGYQRKANRKELG
eukprot:TRINITY_DN3628_c1_g1_i1.p1 TRINITY_DN3628_c1_g1~~TRINITY_DN3628_c1_g1_i1.p1  ORF type:complete len:176 (+),score=36.03 TRINITY_DN3628_c1_g1_i1:17-544(+)